VANAFFFESQGRQLLGIYHEPKAARASGDSAVLICPPIGLEFLRTHWVLRQLAAHLTRAGAHVLRFDYFGTGDSEGDGSEGRIEHWLGDIQAADRELREMSGVSKVTVVGLRLGATLAAKAIATGAIKARVAVFWDPVIDGRSYLAGLNAMQDQKVGNWLFARGPLQADEILGFPFPAELRDKIEALDLTKLSKLPVERVHLVVSKEDGQHKQLKSSLAPRTELELIPDAANWDAFEEIEAALLASRIVRAVTSAAAGRSHE